MDASDSRLSSVWHFHGPDLLCISCTLERVVRDGPPFDAQADGNRTRRCHLSSDPILFLIEFGLNVFLIAMGGIGVLAMCREIIGEMVGPQSRLLRLIDWHYANQMPSIALGVAGWFLLIVFAFGLLNRGA
jgi:hypothetical protein